MKRVIGTTFAEIQLHEANRRIDVLWATRKRDLVFTAGAEAIAASEVCRSEENVRFCVGRIQRDHLAKIEDGIRGRTKRQMSHTPDLQRVAITRMSRENLVGLGEDALRLSIDQVEIGEAEPNVHVARRQFCCSQQVNGRPMNLAKIVVRQPDLSNAMRIVAVDSKRPKVFLYGSSVLLSSEKRIAGRQMTTHIPGTTGQGE